MDLAELLSAGEAADYLGISRPRIYELVKLGRLRGHMVAGHITFTREALDAWRATKKVGRPRSPTSRRSLAAQRARRSEP